MNVNGPTLLSIVTAPLIIGSLLGASYAARKPKPAVPAHSGTNIIRLEIDPAGKVVLAPQVNDVVEWFVQPTQNHPNGTAAFVSFPGFSPCQGNPNDTLTYCFIQKEGHFDFKCDPRNSCVDPGMDPRSQTGTVLLGEAAVAPAVTPAPALATEPPPLDRIRIDCENQLPKPTVEPISVLYHQKIPWFDAPGQDFTITTTPRKFCAEDDGTGSGVQSYHGLAVCTATGASGSSATYTVQGACPNSNKTFNISVK